jgi:hypothetical protein
MVFQKWQYVHEKVFNITNYQGNANQTTMKYLIISYLLVQMVGTRDPSFPVGTRERVKHC